jgi:hypothetical protein
MARPIIASVHLNSGTCLLLQIAKVGVCHLHLYSLYDTDPLINCPLRIATEALEKEDSISKKTGTDMIGSSGYFFYGLCDTV